MSGPAAKRSRTEPDAGAPGNTEGSSASSEEGAADTAALLAAAKPWYAERLLAALVRLAVLAVRECDSQIERARQAVSMQSSSSSAAMEDGTSHPESAGVAPHVGLCRLLERLMELLVDLLS